MRVLGAFVSAAEVDTSHCNASRRETKSAATCANSVSVSIGAPSGPVAWVSSRVIKVLAPARASSRSLPAGLVAPVPSRKLLVRAPARAPNSRAILVNGSRTSGLVKVSSRQVRARVRARARSPQEAPAMSLTGRDLAPTLILTESPAAGQVVVHSESTTSSC